MLLIDGTLAKKILSNLNEAAEDLSKQGKAVFLIVAPQIRRHVSRFVELKYLRSMFLALRSYRKTVVWKLLTLSERRILKSNNCITWTHNIRKDNAR